MFPSRRTALLVSLTACLIPAIAAPDGAAIFTGNCAICHRTESGTRAPDPDALRRKTRKSILTALESGTMATQGASLTAAERLAVATYLVPKESEAAVTRANACPTSKPLQNLTGWNGWGIDSANSRRQSVEAAGLTADQIPNLKLKWAFGIPNTDSAFAQPTAVGGRLFFGAGDGTVYSLDAKTGCTYWTFQATSTVRSAISVGLFGKNYLAFFGDIDANVYALNASTGTLEWKAKADAHPFARVTGAPMLHEGRIYVPVSSVEEVSAGNSQYPCCTFRGGVVAYDARTGKQIWKAYTISDPPTGQGKSKTGATQMGPSGAGVWSAPTIDAKRHALYVGTGDSYSDPPARTSDGVVAFDLNTGSMLWSQQLTPGDSWNYSCASPNKANCPQTPGQDLDVGSSPILVPLPNGHRMLLVGQKSGVMHALDPDDRGKIVWQTRIGQGGPLGGIVWGSAADDQKVYIPLSDIFARGPGALSGGMFALDIATGKLVWNTPAPKPACAGKAGCSAAQIAPPTLLPGVVFSGSMDGHLRAYATTDGKIIWDFDTLREYESVNGVKTRGGSLSASGPTLAGGMLFVNSGYGSLAGMPGNALLAFDSIGR
ncbi:MAG TPA: PQQ-binding-like beta-propeller repeat protein [Bryobacteraceae bacterium]|nr:PQQ-binding-like beta-propeller repeat protein [Bryobacteraceae bacterium]